MVASGRLPQIRSVRNTTSRVGHPTPMARFSPDPNRTVFLATEVDADSHNLATASERAAKIAARKLLKYH